MHEEPLERGLEQSSAARSPRSRLTLVHRRERPKMKTRKNKVNKALVLVRVSAEPSNNNKGVFFPINRAHSPKGAQQRRLVSTHPAPPFLTR